MFQISLLNKLLPTNIFFFLSELIRLKFNHTFLQIDDEVNGTKMKFWGLENLDCKNNKSLQEKKKKLLDILNQ